MVSKKVYIVLLMIIAGFFTFMFLTFGVENVKESNYTSTIIVGNSTVWDYSNKNWMNLRSNTSIDKLNWNKFLVYSNNEKVGEYSLWHDDKWYVFDDDKNSVKLDGDLLAISANFDVKVLPFQLEQLNDEDMKYVYSVLQKNNLSLDNKFTSIGKVRVDFDNDKEVENFYVMSNVFATDFTPNMIFSIVFMIKDNSIYYIYNDISENRSYNGCKPYFNSFIDVNNDNQYEFILSCGRFGSNDQIDMLYEFEENAFKIAISNQ
ncbi:MAG: hypothetical protein IJ463_01010 [Bacilli bacterium]|nr:hypothetical protein [Bacilli bacterium]